MKDSRIQRNSTIVVEEKPNAPFKARVIAWVLFTIMSLLGLTYRIERFEGLERWKRLLTESRPVILASWHNRLFYFSVLIMKDLLKKGFKLAIMSSLSKDGEIGAIMGRRGGVRVVRGSSTKGGTAGFRSFFRVMKKEGYSVIILPDGSKGPRYESKKGVVFLAQLSGNPVVPMSYSADRYWEIPSWDRLIIPKPFAKISIVIGEDIRVERKADEEQLESYRKQIEDTLMELNARSQALSAEK